jgi:hypothetical protein
MIPGWHAENRIRAEALHDQAGLASVVRLWIKGDGSAGWNCDNCGDWERCTGASGNAESARKGAAAHWCQERGSMTSSWDQAMTGMNSQIRAASTIPAAVETAPDSSFPCPGCGYRFAGRIASACRCQYCGFRFPEIRAGGKAGTPLSRYGSRQAPDPPSSPVSPWCPGPHPPGLPWPCGCRFLSRYGSLAGIPEPLPPPVYGSYDWPEPPPGPPRPCAGCGLEDHMPWPAGPSAMCSYCAARCQLSPRPLTPADWLFSAPDPLDPDACYAEGSDLARWPRMRDLIPRMRDLTAAAAIATVILVTMGAYTAAAILIVILSVVAVIRR